MRRFPLLLLILTAALPAAPGRAQEADESEPVPGGVQPVLHGELRLALIDAIGMAIENNLDVEIARHAPLIALDELGIAWGAYDPFFEGEFGFAKDESPVATGLQPGQTRTVSRLLDGSSGVTGLIPYFGGSYGLEYTASKLRSTSRIVSLLPEFRTGIIASLRLPLMRDLVWNEPWTQVQVTRILVESEREQFRRELMDTVRDTERAYWTLIASEKQLRVEVKSLETARALLDQTRTQYEVGVVSRVEVTEAEAGVAEREVNRIRSENVYRSAQDQLIDLVLGPYLEPESRLEILATDDPEEVITYDIDLEEAARKAFEKRPELAAARQEIERQRVLLAFARNQRLPTLDVLGSIGVAGLSGDDKDPRDTLSGGFIDPDDPPPPPVLNDQDFFDAYSDLTRANPWSVRGIFSIPLGNNAGRRRVSQSELELRRARTRVRRLEQTIVLEVRQAARDLKSAQEGVRAAERRRLAAAEQLRAERIRLEHGESTPFDVLERERDFVESESQKIAALQLYHTSVAELDRAQGTTLSSRNIQIDDAARLR